MSSARVSSPPVLIERLRSAHPDVRLEIGDVGWMAVCRRGEAGDGILSARPGNPGDDEPILRDDRGMVRAEGGPVHRAHTDEGEGSGWDLLERGPPIAHPLRDLIDDPCVRACLLASALVARGAAATLSFVRRGLGAGILPFDAVRARAGGTEFPVPAKIIGRRKLREIRHGESQASDAALASSSLPVESAEPGLAWSARCGRRTSM